jgi:hypothetical protein
MSGEGRNLGMGVAHQSASRNPFPEQTPAATDAIHEGAGPRRDLSTREGQLARRYRGASRPPAGGLMAGQRSPETIERSPFESRSTVGAGDSFEVSRASRRRMPAETLMGDGKADYGRTKDLNRVSGALR